MSELVQLHGMAYGGAAVGRLEDGTAVFVPGGLPGETVEVEVGQRKPSFARARLTRVVTESPSRIEPPCPHFKRGCGGCQWQHVSYEAQVAFKQDILLDQLRRGAGITEPPLLEPVASSAPFNYRNVTEFHLDAARCEIGFHQEGSHTLVDVRHCPISEPEINRALGIVRTHLGGTKQTHAYAGISAVQVRVGIDALQVALICEDDPRGFKLLAAELAGLLAPGAGARTVRIAGVKSGTDKTRGLHGDPFVRMSLGGMPFRVSAQSFFQVNTAVAEDLAQEVLAQVKPQDRVLDLYSGVGTFAILAADRASEVTAIEAHPTAIADAQANVAEAAADNVTTIQSDVASAAHIAAQIWDVAILDPPRAGCPRSVLDALDARRIVYVSCDPSTLARDLKLLLARGYTLDSARLLDMFSQTYHLESICLLSRSN